MSVKKQAKSHCLDFKLLPLVLAATAIFAGRAHGETGQAVIEPQLATVQVVGNTGSSTYHADDAMGAKSELPLQELPQSVSIITRQAIDDLGATRLDDVLDFVSSVARQNGFGGLWDNVSIRGLPSNENTGMATLLNGFSANRGFNAPRDLAGVERIEFLKGTAAALYGASDPGGTINIVSKRPSWKSATAVESQMGSYGFKRAAFDSTGPIGENFAYRLNVALEDRGSFRDHVSADRQVIAPAFTWKLGRNTLLEYAGEYLQHRTPLDRGVVAVNNRLGAIPRSRFLGEPSDGHMTVRNQTHQLILLHEWSTDWRGRMGMSYRETSLSGFSTEAVALQGHGELARQRNFRNHGSDDIALQAELQGNVSTGAIAHELLLGLETYRFNMDSVMDRFNPSAANPYAINIYRPAYGQPQPIPAALVDTSERERNTAFYVQDAIKLAPQWRLVAGARVDNYRQSLLSRRENAVTRQESSAVSPRIGLSWLASPQWTTYINVGRSFKPNVGSDFAGNSFKPETGRAMELGVKWESEDKRIGASAALFDIRKRDVLTSDPINDGYAASAGEVRSRGIELDLAGRLTPHWRVNASLLLNDVKVTKDESLEVGGRLLNVPKVSASLLAIYEDGFNNGHRYGIGAGINHTGRRLGQARTQAEANAGLPSFELPSYTTVKLVAYWKLSPGLRLTLDVDNVFDSTHYISSYSRVWVSPGAGRTFTLGLHAKF